MESASLRALRQALAWASQEGMSIRGQLSSAELDQLGSVFAGRERWRFELYEPLRAFAHAIPRLNLPDLPVSLNFADVLASLDEVRAEQTPPWPTESAVSETAFAELGYTATSAGISRLREAHTAAWREHGQHNKALLLKGAARARTARAAVIGAGKLYDIPLRKLAERFEQLLLVDVDAAALQDSVEHSELEPELRARLSLVRSDVTGINHLFLLKARAAFELGDEIAIHAALLELLHSYRVDPPPRLVPVEATGGQPLDFVCSSMVLSQLAAPLTDYVERRFAELFPDSGRTREFPFQVALGQFTHRVQAAHIASLLDAAPCAALSSDTAEQYTALDARGTPVRTSPPLPLIGAASLEELIPTQRARIQTSSQWIWRRLVPSASKPHGRLLQVTGIVVERKADGSS